MANPELVLAEVARVLRPGGQYLFIEHVAADPGTIYDASKFLFFASCEAITTHALQLYGFTPCMHSEDRRVRDADT